MDITFNAGSISRAALEALLMADYDAGALIWQDLQDSTYNSGRKFEGEFLILHSDSRTVLLHETCPSYAAAVERACGLFFSLENGETPFSAVSHCAGVLMPMITIEWTRHEDYPHSITIYPRFAAES